MKTPTDYVMCLTLVACGYPDLPPVDTGELEIAARPQAFVMHLHDLRQTRITVTNHTAGASGPIELQVDGFSLGEVTFSSNTCMNGLAPGEACTAIGDISPTTIGEVDFEIMAVASSGWSPTSSLSADVLDQCPSLCGAFGSANCCTSSVILGNAADASIADDPFYRSYDVGTDAAYPSMDFPASVSDFRLDVYEVTVGRFRSFVAAGQGIRSAAPPQGAGSHPLILDSGWDSRWNSNLAVDTSALLASLACGDARSAWTGTEAGNEQRPMGCVTWYEAMAFCIWDGGYLPTEAEWNYAAAGGSEQRAYPWSSPPRSLEADPTKASYLDGNTYDCPEDGNPTCTFADLNPVGMKPAGNGKWGQADIAGNVGEWTLDSYTSPYATQNCDNCASVTGPAQRAVRGGSIGTTPAGIRTGRRIGSDPLTRIGNLGFRCARMH